ncbi:MAG: chromosomal replication initiator protein DnaA [Prevotella sp.]|nr:chromosomal replication initiator protein DnaA [Prevotella sp.]MBP5508650.1 chromosomal replication initiator protein DnaA [Prevotella sp.]
MKQSPTLLWEECLKIIKANVTEQQFKTWFEPIVFESYSPARMTVLVQVPSQFVYEYLEENFVDLISKVLRRVFGSEVRLEYHIITDKTNNMGMVVESETPEVVETSLPQTMANQPYSILDAAKPQEIDSQLNPHQTFDNFIEGVSNKLPRAVGLTIAQQPATTMFNPMFIYGPSGCGKTHLINAIGLRIKKNFPQKRVLYVSARLFQVQYTNAVRYGTLNDFINFYQTVDVLLVDDIQEWTTSPKTQNTFFHIFDHLFRNGKRILLACDRPPVDLEGMNDRLLTRFSCGLIAELEKPDPQLCVDILHAKIKKDGLEIPEEVILYIADNANGSVRDLEGVVNSLMAYSVVYGRSIDMALATSVLKRSVKVDNKPLTVDEIVNTVCNQLNVSPEEVGGKSRKRNLVVARQVSMYLAQKHTKMPASRIGKLIAGRDHSTVLHSCEKVEQRMKTEKDFTELIEKIERSFRLKN